MWTLQFLLINLILHVYSEIHSSAFNGTSKEVCIGLQPQSAFSHPVCVVQCKLKQNYALVNLLKSIGSKGNKSVQDCLVRYFPKSSYNSDSTIQYLLFLINNQLAFVLPPPQSHLSPSPVLSQHFQAFLSSYISQPPFSVLPFPTTAVRMQLNYWSEKWVS